MSIYLGVGVGKFVPKKVITLAPDAMIFINGNRSISLYRLCGLKRDIQQDITSFSISLSVDSVPSSASISITTPRIGAPYSMNGRCVFSPMQEVHIYVKGRFLVDGKPQYYLSFWGMITNVTESYGDGAHSISLSCKDMLRWWQIMRVWIQPSIIAATFLPQITPTAFVSKFANMAPFQIIRFLAEISHMQAVTTPISLRSTFSTPEGRPQQSIEEFRKSNDELILYWQKRLHQIGKALRIFGFYGERLEGGENIDPTGRRFGSSSVKAQLDKRLKVYENVVRGKRMNIDRESVRAYTPFFKMASSIGLTEHDVQTKLDIALQVKNFIHYEFFQDGNGEIIFKPPFYNLNVKNCMASVIEDEEIYDWSFEENEDEIKTRIDVLGAISVIVTGQNNIRPYGYHIDYKLAKIYGLRQQTVTMEIFNDSRGCSIYARGELDRINASRFRGSVTIPGRPELRLGYPVYIKSRDTFYYVKGINHNFSFGGSFTTSLTLETARRKYIKVDEEKAIDIRRDGEKLARGLPNRVLEFGLSPEMIRWIKDPKLMEWESAVSYLNSSIKRSENLLKKEKDSFMRSFYEATIKSDKKAKAKYEEKISKVLKVPSKKKRGVTEKSDEYDPKKVKARKGADKYYALKKFKLDRLRETEGKYVSGTAQGKWTEKEVKGVIEATEKCFPLSDEEGYEVVGAYPYGRNIVLGNDGVLRLKKEVAELVRAKAVIADLLRWEKNKDLRAEPISKGNDDVSRKPASIINRAALAAGMQPRDGVVCECAQVSADTSLSRAERSKSSKKIQQEAHYKK